MSVGNWLSMSVSDWLRVSVDLVYWVGDCLMAVADELDGK